MSNVVQLFAHEQMENPANPTNVAIAVVDLLAVFAELERATEELSKHLDSVDHFIDPIGNPEARKRQDQLREASTIAARNLSQAIRKFPILQISAILEPEQVRSP
jgi:hypothetical protein